MSATLGANSAASKLGVSNEKISDSHEYSEIPTADRNGAEEEHGHVWRPLLLTPWVPSLLCVVLILLGIGLEIAYHFTVQRNGWSLPPDPTNRDSLHYIYTWVPVIIVMGIVTVFSGADYFIMKMQPYVDLTQPKGAPGESLLLDYTDTPKFMVWFFQLRAGHFVGALSTVVLLSMLTLQPLASSLLVIKNTPVERDPIIAPKFGIIGLNETFSTLQGFASAAGFAEADARYDIGRPPFVWQAWTVDPFERPKTSISNGTMTASTTAIRTLPSCVAAERSSYNSVAGGTQITGSWQGCTVSFTFDNTADSFGVDVTRNCTAADITSLPDPIKPVVFWFASPKSNPPVGSLVFCRPKLSLHQVDIMINIANGSLINVVSTGEYIPSGDVIYSPPFNGQAFNGVEFNLTGATPETILRANTTQLQLPASVLQIMERENLATVLQDPAQVVDATARRYELFLALSARSNYFVSDTTGAQILVSITEIQQRLWMSALSTHALAAVMVIGGLLTGIIHFLHARQRRNIKLYAPPGSIAVAASATRDSPVNGIIQSGWDEQKFRSALKDQTFGMDATGKIVRLGGER